MRGSGDFSVCNFIRAQDWLSVKADVSFAADLEAIGIFAGSNHYHGTASSVSSRNYIFDWPAQVAFKFSGTPAMRWNNKPNPATSFDYSAANVCEHLGSIKRANPNGAKEGATVCRGLPSIKEKIAGKEYISAIGQLTKFQGARDYRNVGSQLLERGFLTNLREFPRLIGIPLSSLGLSLGDSERAFLSGSRFSAFASSTSLEGHIESVSASGLAQRTASLANSDDKANHGSKRQYSPDDRRYRCNSGFSRCFFSSDGGPPLSAQVSGLVILSVIAGIGIALGIGPVGRLRRWGWRGGILGRSLFLCCGASSFGLFIWLLWSRA